MTEKWKSLGVVRKKREPDHDEIERLARKALSECMLLAKEHSNDPDYADIKITLGFVSFEVLAECFIDEEGGLLEEVTDGNSQG